MAFVWTILIPVYKKGDSLISIIPTTSKIFEKTIDNRFIVCLEDISYFCPNQFGFRRRRLTEDALLNRHKIFLYSIAAIWCSWDLAALTFYYIFQLPMKIFFWEEGWKWIKHLTKLSHKNTDRFPSFGLVFLNVFR